MIYVDNAATTKMDDVVFAGMLPYIKDYYGNASSQHSFGQLTRKVIAQARHEFALALNAKDNEIFFTSCGSESDNWAIKGVAQALRHKGNHIITTSIEHPAILNACKTIEKIGLKVTYLPVDKYGMVSPYDVQASLRPNTILISIMYANNEVGTLQPIKEIGLIAKKNKISFHTDAVQAVGHVNIDVIDLNVDLLSASAHKFNGPKGVGILYIKDGTPIVPLVDVSISVAMPEFDGALITVPVSAREITEFDAVTGANITKFIPIPERVSKLVRLSMRWGRLRHLPNEEKKIAIIFHNYPPRNDNIGSAFGLDSPASVWNILNNLQESGYKLDYLPEDGQALMEDILDRVTNDRRWASAQELMQRAVDSVSPEQYCGWFRELPEEVRDKMTESWGEPPGEVFCYGNKLLIPGIINGNIFIGLQPPRGFLDDPAKIYHSPDLPIPHHYLAYYRWIRDVFCADAVMHIGKHGSLEWLPGKGVGLSASCFPDLVISDLPNIYPYIINNPGEGTQAKRRSYCCIIDHLVPVMHNADTYEEMAEVEKQLEDYYNARAQDPAKLPYLEKLVWEKVCEAKLNHDLGLAEEEIPADFNAFVEKLHSYLSELKDTQIRDGLHILGEPPIGTRLVEFLVALTRLPNGDVPSLRQSLAEMLGYDYEHLLANRGKMNTNGKTNGQILEEIHQLSLDLMASFEEVNFDENEVSSVSKEILGKTNPKVEETLLYVAQFLADRLAATTDELTNARNALDGQFIPAGPSGAPTRGMANILPTGRNFYSVDPQAIPSPAAWKVGVELADNLLARYLSDEGCYPENIGIVIWGTGVMRTKGDDIAEILYLLGVRPVWQPESGRVKGIEVIPLEELKRPRIDVTLRISGLFRDAFPNIVEMIDEAVEKVAFLDEPPEQNFLAKHVQKDITDKVEQGFDLEQAREEACYRIFGCKPGAYGAGVSDLIDAQNWRDEQDLGQVYVVWGGYAYGNRKHKQIN
jgi:cobaltochelatase CobN